MEEDLQKVLVIRIRMEEVILMVEVGVAVLEETVKDNLWMLLKEMKMV